MKTPKQPRFKCLTPACKTKTTSGLLYCPQCVPVEQRNRLYSDDRQRKGVRDR